MLGARSPISFDSRLLFPLVFFAISCGTVGDDATLRNAAFKSLSGWSAHGNAHLDPAISRQVDNTGSLRIATPWDRPGYGRALSSAVSVETGLYSFSFYIRSEQGPTYVSASVKFYNSNGLLVSTSRGIQYGTTRDDSWEECVFPVSVPPGVGAIRLQLAKRDDTKPGGKIWVDDVRFGPGLVFREPRPEKAPFLGERVRVDTLGNFEIRNGETWEPFFPLCIYADHRREDWGLYSDQGWNAVPWAGSAVHLERARDAKSDFNPNGLLAGFSIAPYTAPFGWGYANLDLLESQLEEIYRRNLHTQLLMFYWDNEKHHDEWEIPERVHAVIDRYDRGPGGERLHPTYALQGNFGTARAYLVNDWVHVSGTYMGTGSAKSGSTGREGWQVLDRLDGQTSPSPFAQFNGLRGEGEFRLRLYNALIAGARAVGVYRDGAEEGRIEEKRWWPDVPHLRREIDQLLPLIRQPHTTPWTASVISGDGVEVGTRSLDGQGYLILVNRRAEPVTVEIEIDLLPVDRAHVVDVLSGERIGIAAGRRLTVELDGLGINRGSRVVRLVPPQVARSAP